ncbi:MAG: (2Fe-2S)-binding protein [bacterium]|nr:(2Fe-2S)-binding protein [bacterium]
MGDNVTTDTRVDVSMTVNGDPVEARVDTRLLLAHFLREEAELAGVRIGCDTTSCGACAVLLDGRAIKSCTLFAVQAGGRTVTTIEGIAGDRSLHPVQEAFREEHALQCGFCTSGFVMATIELLDTNSEPTEDEVREGLSGNLCRCTGYANIVSAALRAAEAMRSAGKGLD